jgi:hypothetical protein
VPFWQLHTCCNLLHIALDSMCLLWHRARHLANYVMNDSAAAACTALLWQSAAEQHTWWMRPAELTVS